MIGLLHLVGGRLMINLEDVIESMHGEVSKAGKLVDKGRFRG